jgi:hypothetical protein
VAPPYPSGAAVHTPCRHLSLAARPGVECFCAPFARCRRGLDTKGLKAVLVKRLTEALAADTAAASAGGGDASAAAAAEAGKEVKAEKEKEEEAEAETEKERAAKG